MVQKLKEMKQNNIKIIYLDETAFTKRSIQSQTYAAKGKNIYVDELKMYSKPSYVIAGVS